MSNLVSIQLILKGNTNDRLYLGYQKTAYDALNNITPLVFIWDTKPHGWEISNFNKNSPAFSCPIATKPSTEYSINYLQPDMSSKGPYYPILQVENKCQLIFEKVKVNDTIYSIYIDTRLDSNTDVGENCFLGLNNEGEMQFLKQNFLSACWSLEQIQD